MAILVRWWQLVARWKGHDRGRRFGRSAADRTNNNIAYMAAFVSTFESASRFEGANESSARATMSTNVVALSYRTFSLAYLLVEYAFRAAILIAYLR